MVEFISQILNLVVVALNAFDLAILNESQPLNLDLDIQDQSFQISVNTSVNQTLTSVDVVMIF